MNNQVSREEIGARALAWAYHWIGLKWRTVFETRRQLKRKNFRFEKTEYQLTVSEIDETIKTLLTEKWLDDRRYANEFVALAIRNNPRGAAQLKVKLKRRGIPDDLISVALEQLNDNVVRTMAKGLLEKKKRQLGIADVSRIDYKQKARLGRYLFSRGIQSDIIWSLLEG